MLVDAAMNRSRPIRVFSHQTCDLGRGHGRLGADPWPTPVSVLAQARPDLTYEDVNAIDLSAFNEQVYLELETGPSLGDPGH